MKRDKKLFLREKDFLCAAVKYRQRFDACPHFMWFLGKAHCSLIFKTKFPFGQHVAAARFSKDKADWYHIESELKNSADALILSAKKTSDIAEDMVKKFKKYEKSFYSLCQEIDAISISDFSLDELSLLYKRFAEAYTKKLISSGPIDSFALSTDRLIADMIHKELANSRSNLSFAEVFEALTAPTFLSFLQEEELMFVRMMQQIKDNPELRETLFKQHQEKYFWIHNNYVSDAILSLEHFEDKYALFAEVDLPAREQELQTISKRNLKNKGKLIEKLQLSKRLQQLLQITDVFSYWQDERKKGTFFATHYLSLILEAIVIQTKYNFRQLLYTMPDEISQIFDESLPTEELDVRYKDCLLIWRDSTWDIITNSVEIEKIILDDTQIEEEHELRGIGVSLGTATGVVRVLKSVQELSKVKKGDIIVAVMTRPDYVPAMEKAAAFITDEGGLTCHAAVVAREFDVPCIVGCRTASKIFKDGDIVKVDANHGWVRKVEFLE